MAGTPAVRIAICAGLLAAVATAASGGDNGQALEPRLDEAQLVQALQAGGTVILMRHMATESVTPPDEGVDLADCSTQRNLSEQGRRQATRLGESFHKLGIRVGEVLSSPWCRCIDTARLAFGRFTPSETLSLSLGLSPDEKDEQGRAIRDMLATSPKEPGTNTILITHTGSLLYSFGLDARPEGIAHVFRPAPVGPAVYLGSLAPDRWPELAGITP